MTRSDAPQQARALAEQAVNFARWSSGEFDSEGYADLLASALREAEQRVWEEAQRKVQALCNEETKIYVQDKTGCDHPNVECVHNGNAARVADNFRIWCRQQAKGREEEG